MKIAIGCDHRGYDKKRSLIRILEEWGFQIIDKGCFSSESCDYPDFARVVCGSVLADESERGILLCGSGIGMSIMANKFPGIRAALCNSTEIAEMTREHHDSNILCLAADDDNIQMAEIIDTWIKTEFEGGRHARRVAKIDYNPGDLE